MMIFVLQDFYRRIRDLTKISQWSEGKEHELAYWKVKIADPSWPKRDTTREIASAFRPYIENTRNSLSIGEEGPSRILVVGSGPASDIGYRSWSNLPVLIQLTDPLADNYLSLYKTLGVTPPDPVKTIAPIFGEDIHKRFGSDYFDLAYSVNAIDHSYDPMVVMRAMYKVTRPCGWVVFEIWENEASIEGGNGMHKWNIAPHSDGHGMLLTDLKSGESYDVLNEFSVLGAEASVQRWKGCFLNGDCNRRDDMRIRLSVRKMPPSRRDSSAMSCMDARLPRDPCDPEPVCQYYCENQNSIKSCTSFSTGK